MSIPLTEQAAGLAIESAARALHLPTVRQQAEELAEAALRDRLSHRAFLAELLTAALEDRNARRRELRIREARFPRPKQLADFDVAAAPTSASSRASAPATAGSICSAWTNSTTSTSTRAATNCSSRS